MTKEDILDYVMNSPENTNRMVLNDMIDEFVNSSSGAGIFIVPIHLNEETWNYYTEVTFDEIYAAMDRGDLILASSDTGMMMMTMPADGKIRFSSTPYFDSIGSQTSGYCDGFDISQDGLAQFIRHSWKVE